jgi:hypothetical protein
VTALGVEASLAVFRRTGRPPSNTPPTRCAKIPNRSSRTSTTAWRRHLGDVAAARRRVHELRQMDATDLADPLEGLVRRLETPARGRSSALTSTREAADLIKTAIHIARVFFG